MSIDRTKLKILKHLALAQPEKEWSREEGEPSMIDGARMYYVKGPTGVSCWEHGARDRLSASYIAAADPATILALLTEIERLKAENTDYQAGAARYEDLVDHFKEREREALERAAYWRQRAKSAEGHLYGGDFQAACDEVHRASNYSGTPFEQLEACQVARISSLVNAVLRTVNAQRDRRRPADVTGQRDNQNLTHQASNHSVD